MSKTQNEILQTKSQADIDWALGLNRYTLRLMGVWPDEDAEDEQSLTVLLRVPFMIFVLFLFLFLPQTYALVLVISDLPLVIENLLTNWSSFACCIKLFFMWRSKKCTFITKIRCTQPVIKTVIQDWLRTKSGWELKTMKRQANRARLFTITCYATIFAGYSGFAFMPLVGFQMRTITNITDHGNRYLSVQAAYPYDYSNSPGFEITQLSQIFAGLILTMSISIPDNYFGLLVFHFCAQFEILGNQIQNLQEDTDSFNGSNTIFYKKFRAVYHRHVHLLLIVSTLEKAFSFVIASQVLNASLMIVCFGFQVQSLLNNTIDKASLIRLFMLSGCLFTLLLHNFIDCFASEILITYNAGILQNVYKSRWYIMRKQRMRDLIPVMIVAMKSKPLAAGKIFDLTLQSYCSILKTSMGYISMLLAVSR